MIRAMALALLVALFMNRAIADDDWQHLTPAVVRVQCGNSGGTGTLVYANGQEGYVVTCAHVVSGGQTATASWRDGYQSSGPIVGRGQSYDTAIFRVTPPPDPVVIPLADEDAEEVPQGEEVDAFGYGGQHGIRVSQIQLIRWRSRVRGYKSFGDCSLIALDPHAQSGDSGGPIVYRGRLVGIVSGGQLESYGGRPIDSHGPWCRPIRNLLRAIAPHALVEGVDAIRAQRTQPGCYPYPPASDPGRDPARQVVPPVVKSPVQRPLPHIDPRQECPDLADVKEQLAAVAKRLDELSAAAKVPGPPGPAGPPGQSGNQAEITPVHLERIAELVIQKMEEEPAKWQGPQGPAGPRGSAVSIADLTDEDIVKLAKRLPPIRFRKVDSVTGNPVGRSDEVRLGEGFTFFLKPKD